MGHSSGHLQYCTFLVRRLFCKFRIEVFVSDSLYMITRSILKIIEKTKKKVKKMVFGGLWVLIRCFWAFFRENGPGRGMEAKGRMVHSSTRPVPTAGRRMVHSSTRLLPYPNDRFSVTFHESADCRTNLNVSRLLR